MLTWELSNIAEGLTETRRELSRVATLFEHDNGGRRGAHASGAAAVEAALRGMVEQRLPEVIAALDEEIERDLIALARWIVGRALSSGMEFREQLIAALRTRSRTAVLAAVRSATVSRKAFEENNASDSGDELLRSCLAEAMPELASCGGDRRLLMLTNRQEDAAALAEAVTRITGHAPSVVVDDGNDPALCYEMAGIPLWEAGGVAPSMATRTARR